MSQVNVEMSQEGHLATFDICGNSQYIAEMGESLGGITFITSLWGGPDTDMGWLDGMTGCQGVCNLNGASVTFSNFALLPDV